MWEALGKCEGENGQIKSAEGKTWDHKEGEKIKQSEEVAFCSDTQMEGEIIE